MLNYQRVTNYFWWLGDCGLKIGYIGYMGIQGIHIRQRKWGAQELQRVSQSHESLDIHQKDSHYGMDDHTADTMG